jgi:hypothetical protein
MSALKDAWLGLMTELRVALADTDIRLAEDLGGSVEGGQAVVGPPTALFEGMCGPDQPTGFSYTVYLTAEVTERAVEQLLDRLPALLEAISELGRETTVESPVIPGAFPTGTSELPSYQITAETTL